LRVKRIITLGDSLAYGAGDEADGGIAGNLKKLLRGVDTVNLGVNGAQTGDLLLRLKQDRIRKEIARADVIVLSIGANDLFRSPAGREATLRNPFGVAQRILGRIAEIVGVLHDINRDAFVLLLGGYNPVPDHDWAPLIDGYLRTWDDALAGRFASDERVGVVKMDDIVTAGRLSRYDYFHPGADAYREAAKRIAELLSQRFAVANSSA
jgi:lysophospholipase L1-like esterase